MKFPAFLFCSAFCLAQSLSLSFNPPSVSPGQQTTLSINYTDPAPSVNLTALQFQLIMPAGITPPQTGPSAAFPNGNYIADYNAANLVTLIGGWGTTSPWTVVAIPSGRVASWVMTVPLSAPLGASVLSLAPAGAVPSIGSLLGVDTSGNAVALTAGTATLNVTSIYDLNGDGKIDQADVQLARSIAQGKVANGCVPPFSLVGDGKCNVKDVIMVLLASMGIIH